MAWFIVLVAMVGLSLNIRKHPAGFALWVLTNGFWAWHNYQIGERAQALLFLIFAVGSIGGLVDWLIRAKYSAEALLKDEIESYLRSILDLKKSQDRWGEKIRVNWLFDDAKFLLDYMKVWHAGKKTKKSS